MTEITLTSEQRELLKGYQSEAEASLSAALAEKEHLKEIVATAAESTGLPKRLVAKFFKAKFNAKLEEVLEEAKQLEFLNEE